MVTISRASTTDRILRIITNADKTLERTETVALRQLIASLERSYFALESELLKAYSRHKDRSDLLPHQRKLLILDEIKQYLSLINPQNRINYEQQFTGLVQQAHQYGVDIAGQILSAINTTPVSQFGSSVPIAAIRLQAEDSAKRLERWSEDMRSKISGAVELSLATNQGTRRLASTLRGQFGILKGRAEAIARTETMSAFISAAKERYKDAGVQLVQVIAVSDSRTCPICVARNQKVYRINEVQLPFHVRCRCFLSPFKESWIDAGVVDVEQMVAYRNDAIKELEATGKSVDNGLTPFERAAGLTKPPDAVWSP